jgi:uncharacterized membrane protein YeiH
MTDASADHALPPSSRTAARRRGAGIYGTIVASAVLAAGGGHLRTMPLAVTGSSPCWCQNAPATPRSFTQEPETFKP